MDIGDRIANRRKELGMTQDELAKRIGYKSRSSINKIELNQSNLRQSKIKQIADALFTTPGYIMGWDDEADSPGYKIAKDLAMEMAREKIQREKAEKLLALYEKADPKIQAAVDALLKQ